MRNGSSVFRCMRLVNSQVFASPKSWIAMAVLIIFSYYIYSPLGRIAEYYSLKVTPWLLPFFLSFYLMLLVHGGICLLLFSSVGENDSYKYFVLSRTGKSVYIKGQLLSVQIISFLYSCTVLLLSLLFVIFHLEWDSDWGILLNTMSQSAAQMSEEAAVNLSIVIDGEVLRIFTPASAMLFSFLCLWFSASFLGILILFCTTYFNRRIGIVVAGLFVCLSLFSRLLGSITIGSWLQYISPMTWANFAYLDWYYSGLYPSPLYAFGAWILSIGLMSFFTVRKYAQSDTN